MEPCPQKQAGPRAGISWRQSCWPVCHSFSSKNIMTAKKFLLPLVIFLSFLFASPVFAQSVLEGQVVHVADGDTIAILTPDRSRYRIRLYGIDAPERKMPFGRKSGEALARLVAGENVRVVPMYTDDYGRIVGLVENGDETEVNREMVKNGWAWVYTHFCKADFCREWKIYERQARERKKGLWRGKNPQPPWEWRRYDRR